METAPNTRRNAAESIRSAVAQVTALREAAHAQPGLDAAVLEVKRLQARRFSVTYADLMASGPYQAAARFFLEELYGDKNYAERDAQFSRIAGALQKLFPDHVVGTAVALAELHALTEQLDHAMGQLWLDTAPLEPAARYVRAWRAVGRRADRKQQLTSVVAMGRELDRLTRAPGLRMMLKMMRAPANAAGMGSLQRFLESGFDTFAGMAKQKGATETFLAMIVERETQWIGQLFEADAVACETALRQSLGQAR